MAGETILVIDAGKDIDQRITTTLESKGYLVFTDTSRVVTGEIAEQLSPSLIYIKPPELSDAGFETCRAIHNNPLLKDVPIVVLTSPEGALQKKDGSRYFRDYGIVDFLKLTFDWDELIRKTEEILGKTYSSQLNQDNTLATEDHLGPKGVKKVEKKRSALFLPAIGAAILLVIIGAGFLIYQQFISTRKVVPISALKTPLPLPTKAPETESEPTLPTEKKAKDTSTPVSPSPPASSTPPAQGLSLPTAASQATAKPFYSVQLGAFKNEDYAQVLMKKLRGKGYDAFTWPGLAADKSPIYRVLVNKYEDRQAAEKLAREIESKEQLKPTLYSE